ncbi:MAG TPA: TonB-dependent siderophore receptor [Gemmatimonadaceae bacterium]
MYLRAIGLGAVVLVAAILPLRAQQSARIVRDSASAADSAAHRAPTHELSRIEVVDRAARSGSYRVERSRAATRTDTPLIDVPQAATVLPRAVISDQAMQSMADVVRYLPGVTMGLGEGHRDQPTIRGNSSTADFFVDGVRDDAQYLRDLYNVERVEAIMGANALAFGRGGGGGVLNRVSKQAGWSPAGAVTVESGSFDHARETVDLNMPAGTKFAARLNGMLERSGSYRDHTTSRREGINPTATVVAGGAIIRLDYERFHDSRTVDRGIPSLGSAPFETSTATFFGDPDASQASTRVDAAGVTIEHAIGAMTLCNVTRGVRYDKFYQNVFAGSAVSPDAMQLLLSGYNNATRRDNLFDQADLTGTFGSGAITHVVLLGSEIARQSTDNFRNTAYFTGGTATSVTASADAPTAVTDALFRQSASDADNHVRVDVGAGYLQDQIGIGERWQAVVGLRADRFDLRFHNNRTGEDLARVDRLVSPRAALVFKPIPPLSTYASYSVSHLPGSGDQFSSLTATSQTLVPERFTNREVGVKLETSHGLAVNGALFRLDRTNSTAHDPLDPSHLVQTGAQRTSGLELGVTGDVSDRWQVTGGYALQRAVLQSATTAGAAGTTVPLVPHHAASLWNRVQLAPAAAVGLGIVHQARMYAAIDNSVALPAFTRVDAAAFVTLAPNVRLQANVENLLDARYYATAQGNNNILPGAPRTLRISVTAAR